MQTKKLSFLRLKLQQEAKALEDGLAENDMLGGAYTRKHQQLQQPKIIPPLLRIAHVAAGEPKSLLDIQKNQLRGKQLASSNISRSALNNPATNAVINQMHTTPHLYVTLNAVQKEYLAYESERAQQRDNRLNDCGEEEQEDSARDDNNDRCSLERIEADFQQQQREQLQVPSRKKVTGFLSLLKEGSICSNSDMNYATKPFKYVKKLKDVRIMLERKSNNLQQQLKRSNMSKNKIIEDIKADRVHIRNSLPEMAKNYLSSIKKDHRKSPKRAGSQKDIRLPSNPMGTSMTNYTEQSIFVETPTAKYSSPKSLSIKSNYHRFNSQIAKSSGQTQSQQQQHSSFLTQRVATETLQGEGGAQWHQKTRHRKMNSMSDASFSTVPSMSVVAANGQHNQNMVPSMMQQCKVIASTLNDQNSSGSAAVMKRTADKKVTLIPSFQTNNSNNFSNTSGFFSDALAAALSPEKMQYYAYLEREGLLAKKQIQMQNENEAAQATHEARQRIAKPKFKVGHSALASKQVKKEGILANVYNFEGDTYFNQQSIYKYELEKAEIAMIRRNKTSPKKQQQQGTVGLMGSTDEVQEAGQSQMQQSQLPEKRATRDKKVGQKNKIRVSKIRRDLDDYFHDEFSSNDDSIPSATEVQLENFYEESIKLQNKINQAEKGDLQSKIKNMLRIESVNQEINNLVQYKMKK